MIPFILAFFLGVNFLHLFSELPSFLLNKIILLNIINIIFIFLFIKYYFHKSNKIISKDNKVIENRKLLLIIFKKITIIIFGFSIGFLWCYYNAYQIIKTKMPTSLEGQPLLITGTIDSLPEKKHNNIIFTFAVETCVPLNTWPHPGKIKLSWKEIEPEAISVGDKWQLTVKLKQPHHYSNPGSYDKERYFFQNRLVAEGYVIYDIVPQLLKKSIFNYTIDKIRSQLSHNISNLLKDKRSNYLLLENNSDTNHYPFVGLIEALVMGVKDKITSQQWLVFQNTGTAHLMAISGLHIGMIASFTFIMFSIILKKISRRFTFINYFTQYVLKSQKPITFFAAGVSLLIALFYSFLAGFSIPSQRAFIMICFFMASILLKRKFLTFRNYGIALWIILLLDPLATLSVGFWLSFSAVGIILYGMQNRLQVNNIWWKWGRAQLIAFIGLLPISIYIFQKISFVSPLANLIAIPWVSWFVVPLALLGCFLSLISTSMAWLFLALAHKMLALLWPFLEKLNHFSKMILTLSIDSTLSFCLASVGVLCLLLPKGFPARFYGIILCLGILFPIQLGSTSILPKSAFITILDVGQGLSILIETAKHTILFDAGPKLNDMVNAGDRVILPYLATRGIKKIDSLIVSHGDNDHIGGVQALLNTIPIHTVITSEPWLFEEKAQICQAGQKWVWDDVLFEFLHPDQSFQNDNFADQKNNLAKIANIKRNDRSCVLKVTTGRQSFLVTGDIESTSEQKILQRFFNRMNANHADHADNSKNGNNDKISQYERLFNDDSTIQNNYSIQSTYLLVPHHGSKSSSSEEFIEAVTPKYAIVSAGYRNSYGHPRLEIINRYHDKGIVVLDTITSGAIQFLMKDSSEVACPEQYRIKSKRYWHFVKSANENF